MFCLKLYLFITNPVQCRVIPQNNSKKQNKLLFAIRIEIDFIFARKNIAVVLHMIYVFRQRLLCCAFRCGSERLTDSETGLRLYVRLQYCPKNALKKRIKFSPLVSRKIPNISYNSLIGNCRERLLQGTTVVGNDCFI